MSMSRLVEAVVTLVALVGIGILWVYLSIVLVMYAVLMWPVSLVYGIYRRLMDVLLYVLILPLKGVSACVDGAMESIKSGPWGSGGK